MDIDAMGGPELDHLIRLHVMEIPEDVVDALVGDGWHPSSDDKQALDILRHLQSEDWNVMMELVAKRGSPEDMQLFTVTVSDGENTGAGLAGRFALAFCHAALKFALDRKGVPWC